MVPGMFMACLDGLTREHVSREHVRRERRFLNRILLGVVLSQLSE